MSQAVRQKTSREGQCMESQQRSKGKGRLVDDFVS